jgi:hypothetical protein
MKMLLVALLAAQSPNVECAAALTLRGVGPIASSQVGPYVVCLNSTIGTPKQLRAACSDARAKAIDYHGPDTLKPNVDRAMRWLDSMVQKRATCETHLKVEA